MSDKTDSQRSLELTAGDWISAADVDRLTHELDVAMNGKSAAAPQASLCDVVAQAKAEAKKLGRPLLEAAQPPTLPPGWVAVPVDAMQRWRAAFAEELAAYDIDPPLRHVVIAPFRRSAIAAHFFTSNEPRLIDDLLGMSNTAERIGVLDDHGAAIKPEFDHVGLDAVTVMVEAMLSE